MQRASAPPDLLGRLPNDDESFRRASTTRGPTVKVDQTSGAIGALTIEAFRSTDDEDKGGVVFRITTEDGGSSFIAAAKQIPQGVELHMTGDAEAEALIHGIHHIIPLLLRDNPVAHSITDIHERIRPEPDSGIPLISPALVSRCRSALTPAKKRNP